MAENLRFVRSFSKKVFLLLMSFSLIFVSAAAGRSDGEGDGGRILVGMLVGVSGLGDHSFNDMTYAGLIKITQDYSRVSLVVEDSEKSQQAFEVSLQRLLATGAKVIVANGFYFQDLVLRYAAMYRDRFFLVHDAASTGGLDNVISVQYRTEEGSFLAGIFAGKMSKTGKVGFIGGVEVPILKGFLQGFQAGVKYAVPGLEVVDKFVTRPLIFQGSTARAGGYEIADEMYQGGVDIIYAAAGLTGNGVIESARKNQKFVIGVDSDQDYLARGHVLTSMMKRLDVTTYTEVSNILEGHFRPGIRIYGLKEKGIGLSPMKYTRYLIPDALLRELRELEEMIANKEINVLDYIEKDKETDRSDGN